VPETGFGTEALSAGGEEGTGLGVPLTGTGGMSLGALLIGIGLGGIGDLGSFGGGGGIAGPLGRGLGITVPGGGGISFASLGVFATCLGTVERSPEPLTPISFPDPWPPVGTGPGGILDNGLPSWGGGGGEELAG
jgi:hypothetical protein